MEIYQVVEQGERVNSYSGVDSFRIHGTFTDLNQAEACAENAALEFGDREEYERVHREQDAEHADAKVLGVWWDEDGNGAVFLLKVTVS